MTLFTRVVEFSLVYELWEIFLFERDKYLIFYFAVALLASNRAMILSLQSFEKVIKYLMEMKIHDFNTLCNTYYESITIRSNTPLSFPILISKLGLFESNTIISNEEVDLIESFQINHQMPLYLKELIHGQALVQNSNNNNKFQNLILLSEDEQAVYLCNDLDNSGKLMDPIIKMNALKYSTGKDVKLASNT